MEMPGRKENSGNYRFGYQRSEKDDEVKGEGNSYTTFYRQLDPRLGRWFSVDPKTATTPWESPYMSMGNNTVWRNDVLGDKWKTEEDKKKAEKLNKSLESRKNKLPKEADKFKAKADASRAKGDEAKADNFMARSNEARNGADEIGKAQKELAETGSEDEKTEFTFERKTDGTIGNTYMNNEGTIVIEYLTEANQVHELTHAYQHLTDEVQLIRGGGYYFDTTDEVKAYKRQFHFSPSSVRSISTTQLKNWVKNIATTPAPGVDKNPYSNFPSEAKNKPESKAGKVNNK